MKEIWKDIVGYEGLYQVSNFGRVKSFYGKKEILTNRPDRDGYYRTTLVKNKKRKDYYVHRLVAQNFIADIQDKQVNHKNGIRTDNNPNNLEWCTCKENIHHSIYKLKSRYKPIQKIDNKTNEILQVYESIIEASNKNNIYPQHIWRCANNIRKSAGGFVWKYN